jgi:asparagine synthase (glutamine-hydrolysing)
MCGIAGFIDSSRSVASDELAVIAERMSRTLTHRGPDDGGVWVDADSGVALGHRRLSIVDLSAEGHQPMRSADGRFVLVYNGEIYNFAEMRELLESAGHRFRGHSDTEVLVAGFSQWGIDETLKKTVGMFALASWDRTKRTLHLARDRMGEKPLYYGRQGGVFMFCSELKALQGHPKWHGEIDREAVALLLRYAYVPAPHSIYRGIRKLTPGTVLTLNYDELAAGADAVVPRAYWCARERAEAADANPFAGSAEEAVEALEAILSKSVRSQMVADVPVGAFLSGGIDSTTVVALMQSQSAVPVKTFSIGFHEDGYDEAPHAKAVARHLGTDHTELYVTPGEAMSVIPTLPQLYDEPFADSSQIPTYLVAALARRQVTVSLSGDGGDELFWGYPRYGITHSSWRTFGSVPAFVRRGLSALMHSAPAAILNAALQFSTPLTTRRRRTRIEWQQIADVLRHPDGDSFYRTSVSICHDPMALVRGASESSDVFMNESRRSTLADFRKRMMFFDAIGYLPDDILVKVDRAGMSVSLETRMPLLDHRVVEFAWRLPMDLRVREGEGKWLLRQVLFKYVPKALVERPKMGFSLPINAWLRGPLRDWAESLLAESRLKSEGYFEPDRVRSAWEAHLSGRVDQHSLLWTVLMFQSWLDGMERPQRAHAAALRTA